MWDYKLVVFNMPSKSTKRRRAEARQARIKKDEDTFDVQLAKDMLGKLKESRSWADMDEIEEEYTNKTGMSAMDAEWELEMRFGNF